MPARLGVTTMLDCELLRTVLDDLIAVLCLQAKELEKLVQHMEQQTVPLAHGCEFSVVVSELNELHLRIKRLKGGA
jgi:hypothetical protein